MKLNKKGFTLIELLAVIVILAIIMVIAVPQILNVIENSRKSSWKSNIGLIEEGMELGETITGFNGGSATTDSFSLTAACSVEGTWTENTNITAKIANVAKISAKDTKVLCGATSGIVNVVPETGGQFDGQKTITITKGANGTYSDNWDTQYPASQNSGS